MTRTKIPWADYTWHPVTGCSHSGSPGCDHCYAAALSKRFGWHWGSPIYHNERIDEPRKLTKPARIFVGSMTDLFHPFTPTWTDYWNETALRDIWATMSVCRHHTFMILTKRPAIMWGWFNRCERLPNVWAGVTCCTQKEYDENARAMSGINTVLSFVSLEPLLERIEMETMPFQWVIAGPETGPKKRPCPDEWFSPLATACENWHVPFFDKRDQFTRREWPDCARKAMEGKG